MPDHLEGSMTARRERWRSTWPTMPHADLEQYLRRIGYQHPPVDLGSLVTAHLHAFPFVSIPHRPVESMDHAIHTACHEFSVGDCFFNSIVFRAALDRLGYTVHAALARPLPPGYEDCTLPPTHAILIAYTAGTQYLIDVGFGVDGPRVAVPLDGAMVENVASQQGWWVGDDGDGQFTLHYRHCAESRPLYTFTAEPVAPADYHAMSFYASNATDSPLSSTVVLHMLTPTGGIRFSNKTVDRRHADQLTRHTIGNTDLEDFLRTEIGIQNAAIRTQITAELRS
ncbi:arylamine N-acetyltransferase [Nocardia sp. NPDC058518]|uniref:arylamine N-acetyltransferase family protein n=1 Tax=Nocardia sp. NPDC058518 TaxID=3346534 RepID=UPI003653819E